MVLYFSICSIALSPITLPSLTTMIAFLVFFFFGLSRGLKLEPTPPCNMFSRLGNIARSGKRVNKLNQKILKNKKKIKIFPFRISKY